MGYVLHGDHFNQVLDSLKKDYLIYAPRCFRGGGRLSDTDVVRYGEISRVEEMEYV